MKKNIFIGLIALVFVLPNILVAQEKTTTREERIYALSFIWKEMNYTFAFPETLKKVNLDSLYMAYLPKVEQAKSNYEYYRRLSEFMAHFNEAHTRIYASERPDDTAPLEAINFGERVVVGNIAKDLAEDIPIGSEIIQVNHISVIKFLKDSVYQYINAATPHWKFDKSVIEMF